MKELYNEYFHISEHGKIREKAMLVRVAITAFVMVFCLAAMSISAYAYFSHNVVSGSNSIQAAEFDADVSVKENETTVRAIEGNSYSLPAGKYSVTLTKGGTADTGFCIVAITVGQNNETYHTQQLGLDGENTREALHFTLDLSGLSSENATVTFTPHWGTSRYYGYTDQDNDLYIEEDDTVTIAVTGGSGQSGTSDAGNGSTTAASEQTTTATKQEETTAPDITTAAPTVSTEATETTGTSDTTTTAADPVDTTASPETQATASAETPAETTTSEAAATETTGSEAAATETQTQPTETTVSDSESTPTDSSEAE